MSNNVISPDIIVANNVVNCTQLGAAIDITPATGLAVFHHNANTTETPHDVQTLKLSGNTVTGALSASNYLANRGVIRLGVETQGFRIARSFTWSAIPDDDVHYAGIATTGFACDWMVNENRLMNSIFFLSDDVDGKDVTTNGNHGLINVNADGPFHSTPPGDDGNKDTGKYGTFLFFKNAKYFSPGALNGLNLCGVSFEPAKSVHAGSTGQHGGGAENALDRLVADYNLSFPIGKGNSTFGFDNGVGTGMWRDWFHGMQPG